MKSSLAILMTLAMLMAGCAVPATPAPTPTPTPSPTTQPPGGVPTGSIEVRVTDAPPEYDITSIMVTVSDSEEEGVAVHRADDDGEGEWITLPITGDNPFDLLQLQAQDLEALLATEEVTAGKYTQIRMTIEKVEVTLGDGEPQEATLPSGKLKFVRPFEVVDGETTIILLDFDASKSVVVTGAGKDGEAKIIVKPVVKLSVQQTESHELASVEGTISEVDTKASTVSIIPDGETEPVVLKVTPQTKITLDGEEATLDDLAGLGEGNSVTASYYPNNLKAVQIDAESPPE